MTLQRLRPDLCLVKLAPGGDPVTAGGLLTAPAFTPPACAGKVVQVGAAVADVAVGDIVAFAPSVGDPLDGLFPTPHLLISIRDIDAIIPRRDTAPSHEAV